MSERKVLNKYYPPEFDPNNIPKLRQGNNRQWNIRIMAPFNMRCGTCGEYIYKGKKFNSRKEDVEDDDYLGLKIFRFYIKCPRCVAEISFKTDPQNCDYELEGGATRNFEAMKTAERLARQELAEKEAAEKNNPMKVLENRTKASVQEMDMLETLEDLKQLNSRHASVDHSQVIAMHQAYEQKLSELQEEKDEQFIKSLFGKSGTDTIKRLYEEEEAEEEARKKTKLSNAKSINKTDKPTNILTEGSSSEGTSKSQRNAAWSKSVGSLSSSKSKLGNLVRKKAPVATSTQPAKPETSASEAQKPSSSTPKAEPKPNTQESSDKKETVQASSNADVASCSGPAASGLGLLGAYSDSSEGTESD